MSPEPPDPRDHDEPTSELLPPDPAGRADLAPGERLVPEGRAAGALAELLAQQQRDATAARAQTRELTRTLDELRTSQEYLGTALRSERGGAGRLVAVALLGLVTVAGLGWWGQRELGDLRSSVDGRLAAVQDGDREERLALLEKAHAERVAGLEAALEEVRVLLDQGRKESATLRTAREAAEDRLQRDRAAWSERESELSRRIARLERENGAIAGLEARIASLQDRVGAETARADGLERELRALRAAASVPAPPRQDGPRAPAGPDIRVTDVGSAGDGRTDTAAAAAAPEKDPRVDIAALRAGATRDKAELERITTSLNALLELSPGATSYRIVKIGGVSGRDLLDVRVEGTRDERLERAIEAPLARITVDGGESNVLIDFRDGELIRGPLRAPFFEGRYGLLLDADARRWSAANLSFVTIESP